MLGGHMQSKLLTGGRCVNMRRMAGVLLVLALLVGCSSARSAGDGQNPAGSVSSLLIEDFPEGLGRGYPLAVTAGIDNKGTGVNMSDTPPNFYLELEDGRKLSLHDLRGRPVMINFWATWCGPCRLEMPDIVRQSEAHKDLVVLAINVQEELEAIQPFAEDFTMSMPVVRDAGGDIRTLYELRGMPTSIFIDRQGKIAATWAGLLTPAQLEQMLEKIL
jgi:cytochrome c biogenesis protein CcmG, thiol:disulfide interchange protein DsbE